MMNKNRCLILFARAPMHGQVKTRLAAQLGHDRVYELYTRMLQRQIRLVNSIPGITRQLWVAGDIDHEALQDFDGSRHQQQGDDIGHRMCHALMGALEASATAVLIGCDTPGIDNAYLEASFTALESGHDAVLGPATDGGYVLIGLHCARKALFQGMDWGSTNVLQQTRHALEAAGLKWLELATQTDIDEPADLERYCELVAREYGFENKEDA